MEWSLVRLLDDVMLKTHLWRVMESRMAQTTFLMSERTGRSGWVAGCGCDKRQDRMMVKTMGREVESECLCPLL